MATHNEEKRHVFDISLALMAEGRIDTETLVTHVFNLDAYMEMITVNMNKGKHKAIKTLVSFV
jgi:threonine dehydrogenase-like Zn-dependent dehydrogenase